MSDRNTLLTTVNRLWRPNIFNRGTRVGRVDPLIILTIRRVFDVAWTDSTSVVSVSGKTSTAERERATDSDKSKGILRGRPVKSPTV